MLPLKTAARSIIMIVTVDCGCVCLFLTFPLSRFPLLICIYQRIPCSQATGLTYFQFGRVFYQIVPLVFIAADELCAISMAVFSELPFSQRPFTKNVSCKDLEAVLPSGCFTQESDGFSWLILF